MLKVTRVVRPAAGVRIVVDDPPPSVRDTVQSLSTVEAFTQLFLDKQMESFQRTSRVNGLKVLLTSTNSSGMPMPMKPEKSTVLGFLLLLPLLVLKRLLLLLLIC